MTIPRCFVINPADNVATMLDDAGEVGAAVAVLAQASGMTLDLLAPIKLGHKIALRAIRAGEPVIKFGVPIGHASRDIRAGEWVHLHNCASNFADERSGTLDVQTGATTDTRYE